MRGGGHFSKESFSCQMEWCCCSAREIYDQIPIMPRKGSFTNAFSRNLKTVDLKTFPNHELI